MTKQQTLLESKREFLLSAIQNDERRLFGFLAPARRREVVNRLLRHKQLLEFCNQALDLGRECDAAREA